MARETSSLGRVNITHERVHSPESVSTVATDVERAMPHEVMPVCQGKVSKPANNKPTSHIRCRPIASLSTAATKDHDHDATESALNQTLKAFQSSRFSRPCRTTQLSTRFCRHGLGRQPGRYMRDGAYRPAAPRNLCHTSHTRPDFRVIESWLLRILDTPRAGTTCGISVQYLAVRSVCPRCAPRRRLPWGRRARPQKRGSSATRA